jgi:cytochrome c oxidase cbb3-type subunit IV
MDMQAIADMLYPIWILLFVVLFLAIVAWACWPSRRQKERMDDHARIPFRDDEGNGQPS